MRLLPVLEGLHSAESFNVEFLEALFRRTREIETRPADFRESLRGRVVAHVFEEPSTRTRLSFESAVLRLGGSVLTVSDPQSSSGVKGEALADAAHIVGGYADLLVWRHPKDGASRVVAQNTCVPVINAGDGRLGHPTQTLLDLCALERRWPTFAGRTIGLMGDLKHGRTARSLAWGLALLGVRVVLLPAPGLDWESGFERRILDHFGMRLRWTRHPLFRAWTGSPEARVLEPKGMIQGLLFQDEVPTLERLDALYLTRLQRERGAKVSGEGYPVLRPEQLQDPLLESCLLMHPLPRREELPFELDHDDRALYFEQARLGPVARMAVLLAMLREDAWPLPNLTPLPAGQPEAALGACANANCVTRSEGLTTPWRVVGATRRQFLCALCDSLLPVDYVGCRSTLRVHPIHSPAALRISPENLHPFREREGALEAGYVWGG
jgi:aspartate carbamoyltransferase catalytic subunit